jgi:hypothetical protein
MRGDGPAVHAWVSWVFMDTDSKSISVCFEAGLIINDDARELSYGMTG